MAEAQDTGPAARPPPPAERRSPFLRPSGERRQRFAPQRLSRGRGLALFALTLVIVAAAVGAFLRTQALKQVEPSVEDFDFAPAVAPTCDCPRATARLSFRLVDGQAIDAMVVDEDEDTVRSLLTAEKRQGRVELEWDGRDQRGAVVPPGEYRLQLELRSTGETITVPNEVVVRAAGL
jgi:hypothetical protein